MTWLLKTVGVVVFDNPMVKILGAFAIVAALVGGFMVDQRSIGAERAERKIEKANETLAKSGRRAADGARNERVRGQRDPWTVD